MDIFFVSCYTYNIAIRKETSTMTLRQVLPFLTIIVFLSCCGYNTNNNLDISKTKIESIQTESALDPYVIRTFVQMDPEQVGINLTESKECNLLTYYEMSDGTYMYQGKKYQYKIEKSGLINPTQGLPDELLYIILLIPPKLSELDSEFDKVKEMVIMIHKLNIFNNLK